MLKYLAAVALVFGLSIYVSIQYKQHSESPAGYSQQPANKSLPSPTDKHSKTNISQPEWHPPSWYRLFGWPEGIGVWGLFLTLVAIAEQTQQTRRSADASAEAARATRDQVQTMVERERARLVITSPPNGISVNGLNQQVSNFRVTVGNIGATAAVNIKGWFWASATGSNSPPNEDKKANLGIEDFIAGDATSVGPAVVISALGENDDLSSFYLHLWGRIDYNHLLSAKPCHTTFRFRRQMCQMRANAASPVREWEKCGPKEDNETT